MNKSNQLISSIDELICVVEQDFDNFSSIFDQVVGQIVKDPQHTASFISYLNGQLANASTRRKGLSLLSALIPICPTDVAAEHSIAWINNSLKHCQNEKQVLSISFKIIKPLLELCSKTPELNKAIVSHILEKIIDEIKLIPHNSPNANIALECLLTCLREYPGACGPRKIPVDKYLIGYLDSTLLSPSVRRAGKCLHSLQQVGGGGQEGINYYNNWHKQQQRLIATIHFLMDQFFESVTEFGDYQQDIVDISPLDLPEITEVKNFKKIACRIINTVIYLQEMLLGAYPVNKAVLPEIILNVITRGLAVTTSTIGPHVVEDKINISSYLCLIHTNLLQLLQCLISGLSSDLLPYGATICKLIINCLKNVSAEDNFSVRSICELHLTAYETLKLWLATVKGSSSVDIFMDTLYPIIINDVTPIKTELNLTIQNGSAKTLSKRARRQLVEQKVNSFAARKQTAATSKTINNDSNFQSDVCIASLQTIQYIINYEGSFIKPIIHKQFQEFVVKTLLGIQRGDISYPYTDEDCQIELYKTLIRLTTNYHHNMPPPIQYAITIISNGQNDSSLRVSQTCSDGLSNLNSFIYPVFPTLDLPLDLDEVKAELALEKKNTVQFEMNIDDSEDEEVEKTEKRLESVQNEILVKESVVEEKVSNNMVIEEEIKSKEAKVVEVEVNNVEATIKNSNEQVEACQNDVAKPKEAIDDVSDDEPMEQLAIDETEVPKTKVPTPEKKITEEINLEEKDICDLFVDIVNN